ncbi:MAG: hypothetical protein ACHRXM_15860 [Isosphaerales bacterium]
MSGAYGEQPLGEGDVVYFHDLQLDTARRVTQMPVYQDIHRFEVEGKSRPMLILSEIEITKKGKGVRLLQVLKLSTKFSETKRKLGYVKVGRIVDDDRDSYADKTPYWLPANLIDGRVKKREDRARLNGIYAEIGAKGRPSPRE